MPLDVCDARPRQWWLSPFSLNRMNFLVVVVIGAVLGALDGVGILFEPREPYKWQILSAATLKGVLVALLTGFLSRRLLDSGPRCLPARSTIPPSVW